MAEKTKKKKKTFISKISNYGRKSGRKHIEVPKEDRKRFKSGTHVRVSEIQ